MSTDESQADDIELACDLDQPTRSKRQRKRYIDEITELRAKAAQYSEQLVTLMQRQDIDTICATPWEGISRRQAIERSVAEQDNARLKDAVQEQLTTIQTLLRIVQKRPKLMDASYVEDWKLQRLPADPTLRHRSFHAMLDAEYDRLESVFLAQRLHDATETCNHSNVDVVNDQLVLSCTFLTTVHADMHLVANAYWTVYSQANPVAFKSGVLLALPRVDETTRYTKMLWRYPGNFELHGNLASKRYDESDSRIVFTMRIVLDDELHPYPPEVYVLQQTAWLVVERTGANESCVKYFTHGHVPCKSHRDASRHGDTDLSFAALADHILAGYRSDIWTMLAMIERHLFESTAHPPIFFAL